MKQKAPSFPFYPGDWTRDTRRLSLAAKGAWIDIICEMFWQEEKGVLVATITEISRMIGASEEEVKDTILELHNCRICHVIENSVSQKNNAKVTACHKKITLICRRMERENKSKKSNRSRQEKHRNAKNNADVTGQKVLPSFSSSFSSSNLLNPLCDSQKQKNESNPMQERNFELKKQAKEIIQFLNKKTGHNFREVESNLKPVQSILKSGVSPDEVRQVLAMKIREWEVSGKGKYLRPLTLFRRSNFETYLGQINRVENIGGEKSHEVP